MAQITTKILRWLSLTCNFTQVFDPWFQTWWEFWSLIPQNFVDPERLILDTMKNTADPDPGGRYPRSRGCDPGSHPFFGPWSLIPYTSLRPCNQCSKLLNVLSYMGNGVDIKFPHHFIACQLCKDQWLLNVVILVARNFGRNYSLWPPYQNAHSARVWSTAMLNLRSAWPSTIWRDH